MLIQVSLTRSHRIRRPWNYTEHSGAGQVGWPKLMSVQEVNDQNREYVEYVREGLESQQFLLTAGLARAAAGAEARFTPASGAKSGAALLAVFQPLSWRSTFVVSVPKTGDFERASALRDVTSGVTFPLQRFGEEGVVVAPLPPTAVALFEPVAAVASTPGSQEASAGLVLENRFYRLELRASDGVVAHLIDRESGKEAVNSASRYGFNQLVRLAGLDRVEEARGVITFQTWRGSVFDSIEVSRPESFEPVTEYRLYHALKRLEIRNLLDRARMPVVTLEDKPNTYQFIFPLLPGATIESLQYENGNGLTSFPQGHLPGGRLDAVVSHGLLVAAGGFRVALSSPQAFFWNLPHLNPKAWKLLNNEVFSAVWRKNDSVETRDFGNYIFPTVEPGLPDRCWFVFAVTSWEGDASSGEAYRKIWESVMSPVTAICPRAGGTPGVAGSLFATDHPDVVVIGAAPSLTQEGAVVLRLQEVAGAPRRLRVTLPAADLTATQVDLTETPVTSGSAAVKGNRLGSGGGRERDRIHHFGKAEEVKERGKPQRASALASSSWRSRSATISARCLRAC